MLICKVLKKLAARFVFTQQLILFNFDTTAITMPSSKPYPSPLPIPPLNNDQHTHTIILLHGRGSNSERFGHILLETTALARRLPTVKFVFPTARKRRSTVLKRIPIHQWFDNYSLEDPNTRTELQVEGLEETSCFLRGLVDEEARLLREGNANDASAVGDGYGRVVIGGLSQGCAASVFCLLGGFSSLSKEEDGDDGGTRQSPLGGFIGMSGWLPFEREIAGLLNGESEDDDDDPFSHNDEDDDVPAHIEALNHVRDIFDLAPLQSPGPAVSHLKTPVFLGHGAADPKVSVDLGRRMASILSGGLGMDVTWKAYEDFGHWYKVPDEIDDVVRFLKERVGVPSVG